MLDERLEGRGTLEAWDNPTTQYRVRYQFDIQTDIVERHGFPPVATKRHSQGVIASENGDTFPEGYYRLRTDTEILKVKNLGMGLWVILAS